MLTNLIIITALALAGFVVYDLVEIRNKKKSAEDAERARIAADEWRKREELKKQAVSEYETALRTLISAYGDCSLDIEPGSKSLDTYNHIYFFEQGAMVVLKNEPIPFEKIIGFSLNDDTKTIMQNETTYTSTTTTSTGSMLGRTVVGGVLLGGIGALAGATTAKKETVTTPSSGQTTTTTKHNYSLYLNIDSISNPNRVIELGADTQKAQNLANAINVIIQRNKK